MDLERALLLVYVLLPFVAAIFPRVRLHPMVTAGAAAASLRALILFVFLRPIAFGGAAVSFKSTLIGGYALDFVLSLDARRLGFLLAAELCFLFAHWMGSAVSGRAVTTALLLSLGQGLCSLFVLSDNVVATGGLQMLAAATFFYAIRLAAPGESQDVGREMSRRVYFLHFLLGVLLIVWGILEFSEKNLMFGPAGGVGKGLWLALILLAVPMPPWSRWLGQAIEHLPEGVSLTLVTFACAVMLKFATFFTLAYPSLGNKEKLALYLVGIIGCTFAVANLFAAQSRRRMLGSLPSFFFALTLVAIGVSQSSLILSAYFICIFVPLFTGVLLYASVMKVSGTLPKIFVGMLFALILGVPGTPVYQIFSGVGARSLELGISYTILFGLLWFFYFCANVHICRKIFVDAEPPESGTVSALQDSPISFAGYGVFLMVFAIVATQLAGGLL